MGLFKKKTVTKAYDKENKKPVIKYPLSFSISDSKIPDVDIVGLLILDIYFRA